MNNYSINTIYLTNKEKILRKNKITSISNKNLRDSNVNSKISIAQKMEENQEMIKKKDRVKEKNY